MILKTIDIFNIRNKRGKEKSYRIKKQSEVKKVSW